MVLVYLGSLKDRSASWALRAAVLLLVLLGAGCATPQAFVPLAEVTRAAPDGLHGAADYRLEQPSRRAHVQVWSRGAYRDDTEGKAVTIVHVGFSVENQGPTPIRLDEKRLFLQDIGSTEGGIEQLAPVHLEGNLAVAPQATGTVDAYFSLPGHIWPSDVIGYRVAWAFEGGDSSRVEHTTFESTRARVYLAYYPYYGYYPYYPWGWYGPWRSYPLGYAPYPYWGGPPHVYVGPHGYAGPRVLARPRQR
jgi:hypothetical protein